MYTVKQLAELAGVSVRTLHYYDEIGLLSPSTVGKNQYRYYDDAALLRLQQILLYREIGVELAQIKPILDNADFDVKAALKSHLEVLHKRQDDLQTLIHTVQDTIAHIERETTMPKAKMFEGFSEEKQKEYEREIRLEYGAEKVNESIANWGSYSEEKKQAILAEGNAIYMDIVKAIDSNWAHDDNRVQGFIERWHQHIRYFYEPTLEIIRNLPELYTSHPDFIKNFAAIHPRLGEYIKTAIHHYVDDLETKELERMYEADEVSRRLQG
jgi:DNA-binding transcriptional MerR regulator